MESGSRQAVSASEESIILRMFLRDISKVPILSREREAEILRRIGAGETELRNLLITSNLRFVVRRAVVYWHLCRAQDMPPSLMDLIAEGSIGLIEAVKTFDPSREARIVTYAAFRIKARILRFVYLQRRHLADSLDAPIKRSHAGEDSDTTLLDQIACDNVDPVESIDVEQLLDGLPPRERKVLQMRYFQERNLGQIGAAIGVSPECVRQIEARALFKIREGMPKKAT
jgi:RNA polymerase sigma factor (sigma-70 family)